MRAAPDSSAVRTALWRALHVQIDDPPHLIDDELGLALADPEDGWRDRPDMHPTGTGPYRAAIVARTRFVEDLLVEEGIGQYVLLGAGLDTFAQRHPELAERVAVFEIDAPAPQAWKRQRLDELADDADRPGLEAAARGARASGTPWISFYTPDEIVALARRAGFASAQHLPTAEIAERYLKARTDGLRAASGEAVLLART